MVDGQVGGLARGDRLPDMQDPVAERRDHACRRDEHAVREQRGAIRAGDDRERGRSRKQVDEQCLVARGTVLDDDEGDTAVRRHRREHRAQRREAARRGADHRDGHGSRGVVVLVPSTRHRASPRASRAAKARPTAS